MRIFALTSVAAAVVLPLAVVASSLPEDVLVIGGAASVDAELALEYAKPISETVLQPPSNLSATEQVDGDESYSRVISNPAYGLEDLDLPKSGMRVPTVVRTGDEPSSRTPEVGNGGHTTAKVHCISAQSCSSVSRIPSTPESAYRHTVQQRW